MSAPLTPDLAARLLGTLWQLPTAELAALHHSLEVAPGSVQLAVATELMLRREVAR
jgi:hypothetical protein